MIPKYCTTSATRAKSGAVNQLSVYVVTTTLPFYVFLFLSVCSVWNLNTSNNVAVILGHYMSVISSYTVTLSVLSIPTYSSIKMQYLFTILMNLVETAALLLINVYLVYRGTNVFSKPKIISCQLLFASFLGRIIHIQ